MDSFEQKYCIGTNDGKYQVMWDISKLIKDLINNTQFPIKHHKVVDLIKTNSFFGDVEHAMKTNVESPCIIVKLNEDVEKLIDGNHRLYKANILNLHSIPCYILPVEYHKKFIIDYDIEIYKKVVADFTKISKLG